MSAIFNKLQGNGHLSPRSPNTIVVRIFHFIPVVNPSPGTGISA